MAEAKRYTALINEGEISIGLTNHGTLTTVVKASEYDALRADNARLQSAREVQDAALAVQRNDFRKLALETERLRAVIDKAYDYLSGEFYNEALGILGDAQSLGEEDVL